jgi:ABC-2 type transport system permease protein
LWKRIRSAPVSRGTLLGSRMASAALCALLMLAVMFLFARVVFGVRIEGSFAGFAMIGLAFALMTATFGLLIAALGRTPEATRPIAVLATLVMVMLGGSWVPTFLFPAWLQQATLAMPTRWAVDGLDAMTWRGLGFDAAVMPSVVLLGFAVAFGVAALSRFRWDAE